MSTSADGAFPRARALRVNHRFRAGLSLAVVLLLTLGLTTLVRAQHPPVEKASPPGHPGPESKPGAPEHQPGAPQHQPGAPQHQPAAPGHVPAAAGHAAPGHHENPCKGVKCDLGMICSHGECTKVIDNYISLTGFGKDKEIKNGPILIAILNFAILCFLLWYFARKPIGQFLETRHATVKNDLAEAAVLREKAREKLAEIEGKLKLISDEVDEIKEGVAKDAEFEKQRIVKAANEEADRIIERAEATLEREIRRAKIKLEAEAIEAALKVAEEIVRKQLGEADRKRINEDFISQIASSGGSN